jgi:hypothetical protein
MNPHHHSIQELEAFLQEVASSTDPEKAHLIRALQNAIADKHLALTTVDDSIPSQLLLIPREQLEQWMFNFRSQEMVVPRELYEAIELQQPSIGEEQSRMYLALLVRDYHKGNIL